MHRIMSGKKPVSFDKGDKENIVALFTNLLGSHTQNLVRNIGDRSKLRELIADLLEQLDDEEKLLSKVDIIQKELDKSRGNERKVRTGPNTT